MKVKEMTDVGARSLCAAIITQAVDDYDRVLYQYLTNALDPATNKIVKFEDFDYLASMADSYRCRQDEIEISKADAFFDTEWFDIVSAAVGDYHAYQIRNARRNIIGKKALMNGDIKRRMLLEIFKINEWEDMSLIRR